jgi:hypothetical protein
MGRMLFYVFVLATIVFSFAIAGLIPNGFTGTLLAAIQDPSSITRIGPIAGIILAIVAFAGAAGVAAGFVFPTKLDLPVMAILVPLFIGFTADLIMIWIVMKNGVGELMATLFLSPMILCYVLTIFEWWRGRD